MAEQKPELGKVTRVDFGIEDHGMLGWNIHFTFGGSEQGTGWHYLEHLPNAMLGLRRIFDFFAVDRLEQIKGRYVIVHRAEHSGPIIGLELPAMDSVRHGNADPALRLGVLMMEDLYKEFAPKLSDDHK